MTANGRLLLGLILLLAAALRLWAIDESNFWRDEFCSLEVATGRDLAHAALPLGQVIEAPPRLTSLEDARPWWAIWTHLHLDNHPPLYFLLLRLWWNLGFEGEAGLRFLSVLLGLAAVIFLFDAVRTLHGQRAGLWAAALLAVSAPAVHFSQEVRNYVLLLTLGSLCLAALARIERGGTTPARLIALGSGSLGLLLTHYFALAAWAALTAYAAIVLRGKSRRQTLLALTAAVVLFALAWGPFAWQQRRAAAVNNTWQLESPRGHHPRALERLAVLPVRFLREPPAHWPWLWPMAGAGLWALAIVAGYRRRIWFLWLLAAILPACLLDIGWPTRYLSEIRYTLAGVLGLCALVAVYGAPIAPLLAALFALSGLAGVYWSGAGAGAWQALAEHLQTHSSENDLIVFIGEGRDRPHAGAIYLGVQHYWQRPPAPIVLFAGEVEPAQRPALERRRRIWLVDGRQQPRAIPGFALVEQISLGTEIGCLYELRPQ